MFYAHTYVRNPRRFLFAALLVGTTLLASAPGGSAFAQPSTVMPSSDDTATTLPATNTATAPSVSPQLAPPQSTQSQNESVDNPYGIKAMWQQGDIVSKSTLIILLIMSGASWYILITKLVEQSGLRRQASQVQREFWQRPDLNAASLELPATSMFRLIARAGMVAQTQYSGSLTQQVDLNTWLSQSIGQALDAVGDRLQGGLSVLATVGSTAPFIGLFGTVWGIYHALTAIGIAGQASIDKVAGPVGESLIMTALGLAVAVPAVLGYNWMIRRNKTALDEVRAFGGELHTVLLGGKPASVLGD